MPDQNIKTGFKPIIAGESVWLLGVILTAASELPCIKEQRAYSLGFFGLGAVIILTAYIFVLFGSRKLCVADASYRQCVVSARASLLLWLCGKLMRGISHLEISKKSPDMLLEGMGEVFLAIAILIVCVFAIYTVIPGSGTKYLRRLQAVIILLAAICAADIVSWNYFGNTVIVSVLKAFVAFGAGLAMALHVSIIGSILKNEIDKKHIYRSAGDDGEKEILFPNVNEGSNGNTD